MQKDLEFFLTVETESRQADKETAHLPLKVTTKMTLKGLTEKKAP